MCASRFENNAYPRHIRSCSSVLVRSASGSILQRGDERGHGIVNMEKDAR